ncbi:MAG: hypothetical protein AAF928_12835 [Myxococcota bacterium]
MTARWRWVLGVIAGLVLAGGCSASASSNDDDEDDDGGGSPTTTGTTTAATSGAGGSTSGAGGSGGGIDLPCGVDCSAIDTPPCLQSVCNTGQFPGAVGACTVVPRDAGAPCDDGQFCTVDDTCDGTGTCVGGPPNDCGMTPPQCSAITCDEASQSCGTEPVANGTACTSVDLCLTGSVCTNGTCGGGVPNDCFFAPTPNECFVSQCNPQNGMCEPTPGNDGGACTDTMDLCSVNNTCSNGTCGGGVPLDCSALTQGCQLGVCDTATGFCVGQAVMDGGLCDDLNGCTTGETCSAGMCVGGTAVTTCVDGDGCCPSTCTAQNDTDCAVTDVDVGPFGSIFSSTLTRGFWFTAPVNFTIVELRVPTDVGTQAPNNQNIEVVRFTGGPPPNFSMTTTSYVSLFYTNSDTSSNYIPVSIPVQAGDIIGILGARGTTTMRNSYGTTTTYATTILGQPVTLTRLIYQGGLNSGPSTELSSNATGQYSRIEMRISP